MLFFSEPLKNLVWRRFCILQITVINSLKSVKNNYLKKGMAPIDPLTEFRPLSASKRVTDTLVEICSLSGWKNQSVGCG